MFTLRQKIFIIVGIVAALIIALIFWIIARRNDGRGDTDNLRTSTDTGIHELADNRPSQTLSNGIVIPAGEPFVGPQTNVSPEEIYAKQISRIFVERFGTFSNQNDNRHIEDVQTLITQRMKDWINTQSFSFDPQYEGVTTAVMSMDIREISEQKAIVEVRTNQTHMIQSAVSTSQALVEQTQRKGKVELIRVENDWKVNGFWWED